MEDGNSVEGAALGTTFIVNGLLATLIAKGVMSTAEVGRMLNDTLYTLEGIHARSEPCVRPVWSDARNHVEQMIAVHAPRFG